MKETNEQQIIKVQEEALGKHRRQSHLSVNKHQHQQQQLLRRKSSCYRFFLNTNSRHPLVLVMMIMIICYICCLLLLSSSSSCSLVMAVTSTTTNTVTIMANNKIKENNNSILYLRANTNHRNKAKTVKRILMMTTTQSPTPSIITANTDQQPTILSYEAYALTLSASLVTSIPTLEYDNMITPIPSSTSTIPTISSLPSLPTPITNPQRYRSSSPPQIVENQISPILLAPRSINVITPTTVPITTAPTISPTMNIVNVDIMIPSTLIPTTTILKPTTPTPIAPIQIAIPNTMTPTLNTPQIEDDNNYLTISPTTVPITTMTTTTPIMTPTTSPIAIMTPLPVSLPVSSPVSLPASSPVMLIGTSLSPSPSYPKPTSSTVNSTNPQPSTPISGNQSSTTTVNDTTNKNITANNTSSNNNTGNIFDSNYPTLSIELSKFIMIFQSDDTFMNENNMTNILIRTLQDYLYEGFHKRWMIDNEKSIVRDITLQILENMNTTDSNTTNNTSSNRRSMIQTTIKFGGVTTFAMDGIHPTPSSSSVRSEQGYLLLDDTRLQSYIHEMIVTDNRDSSSSTKETSFDIIKTTIIDDNDDKDNANQMINSNDNSSSNQHLIKIVIIMILAGIVMIAAAGIIIVVRKHRIKKITLDQESKTSHEDIVGSSRNIVTQSSVSSPRDTASYLIELVHDNGEGASRSNTNTSSRRSYVDHDDDNTDIKQRKVKRVKDESLNNESNMIPSMTSYQSADYSVTFDDNLDDNTTPKSTTQTPLNGCGEKSTTTKNSNEKKQNIIEIPQTIHGSSLIRRRHHHHDPAAIRKLTLKKPEKKDLDDIPHFISISLEDDQSIFSDELTEYGGGGVSAAATSTGGDVTCDVAGDVADDAADDDAGDAAAGNAADDDAGDGSGDSGGKVGGETAHSDIQAAVLLTPHDDHPVNYAINHRTE